MWEKLTIVVLREPVFWWHRQAMHSQRNTVTNSDKHHEAGWARLWSALMAHEMPSAWPMDRYVGTGEDLVPLVLTPKFIYLTFNELILLGFPSQEPRCFLPQSACKCIFFPGEMKHCFIISVERVSFLWSIAKGPHGLECKKGETVQKNPFDGNIARILKNCNGSR